MAAVAFALLVTKIMLSAIFQVLIGPGGTVTAIIIAMLGLAASGVFSYVFPTLLKPTEKTIFRLLLWFSKLSIFGILVIIALPLNQGDLAFSRNIKPLNLMRLSFHDSPFICPILTPDL